MEESSLLVVEGSHRALGRWGRIGWMEYRNGSKVWLSVDTSGCG